MSSQNTMLSTTAFLDNFKNELYAAWEISINNKLVTYIDLINQGLTIIRKYDTSSYETQYLIIDVFMSICRDVRIYQARSRFTYEQQMAAMQCGSTIIPEEQMFAEQNNVIAEPTVDIVETKTAEEAKPVETDTQTFNVESIQELVKTEAMNVMKAIKEEFMTVLLAQLKPIEVAKPVEAVEVAKIEQKLIEDAKLIEAVEVAKPDVIEAVEVAKPDVIEAVVIEAVEVAKPDVIEAVEVAKPDVIEAVVIEAIEVAKPDAIEVAKIEQKPVIAKKVDWANAVEEHDKIESERAGLLNQLTYAQRVTYSTADNDTLKQIIAKNETDSKTKAAADGFIEVAKKPRKSQTTRRNTNNDEVKTIMSAGALFWKTPIIPEEKDNFSHTKFHVEDINGHKVKLPNTSYYDATEGIFHPGWFQIVHRAYKIKQQAEFVHVIGLDGKWYHYMLLDDDVEVVGRDGKRRKYPNNMQLVTDTYMRQIFNPREKDNAKLEVIATTTWNDVAAVHQLRINA